MPLNVYRNMTDWVIAESVEDAGKVWCEFTGEREYDYHDDSFRLVPDETIIKVWGDGGPPDPDERETGQETCEVMTARQWADSRGRDFLCSTEY